MLPRFVNLSADTRAIRRLFSQHSFQKVQQQQQQPQHQQSQHQQPKLIYEGRLSNRILYLKSFSIITSLGLVGSFKYALAKKGFSAALAGFGFAFTPFVLSPIIITWFFKRYITHLYYDKTTEQYTAYHYGVLLNKKQCVFRRQDVIRSDFTSVLNTFKVGNKPFFLHDEDLMDLESIEIYRHMVGLDKVAETSKRDPTSETDTTTP